MAEYSFKSFRMVLVDDSPPIRSLLKSVLEIIGVGHIEVAAHGGEAIEILKKTAPRDAKNGNRRGNQTIDIVMTNVDMPTVDGMMFLKWIRRHADSPNRFLPVIMISSYADPAKLFEARDNGVTEFVAKPFTIANVCQRLLTVIERPRQFVQTETYFGPDRRRRVLAYDGPDRRVMTEDSEDVEVLLG